MYIYNTAKLYPNTILKQGKMLVADIRIMHYSFVLKIATNILPLKV